jgi:hypothetical protein
MSDMEEAEQRLNLHCACGAICILSLYRSWVRTMSDMEEAEQRLNLVEIMLANLGLDA